MNSLWLLVALFNPNMEHPALMPVNGSQYKNYGAYGVFVSKEVCEQEIKEMRFYVKGFEAGECIEIKRKVTP